MDARATDARWPYLGVSNERQTGVPKVLIITDQQVEQLLPMDECIAAMAAALKTLAHGGAVLPLRQIMWLPDKSGALGAMPSFLDDPAALGIKVITVFQKNLGTKYDSHQGAVLLFEAEHGVLQAIIDASSVTAIRTAAVSGVATNALARAEAGDLCILGSGAQAMTHLEAMKSVRTLRRVRVWSRNFDNARTFAAKAEARHGIAVEPMASARDAVTDADIICTTTSSREPVLFGEWIAQGAHINAVGSSVPAARELDTAAVANASLFVDRRESTLNEAGDYLFPMKEGAIDASHIRAELGEVLTGAHNGRATGSEITLFKSLGIAIEDLAAARLIHRKAVERGIGTSIALGGLRDAH
jgi:ornithine cyclodeaminase